MWRRLRGLGRPGCQLGSARFKSYWTGEDKRLRSTSLEFKKGEVGWQGKYACSLGIEMALNATRPRESPKEVSANKEGIRVKHEGLVLSSIGEGERKESQQEWEEAVLTWKMV